MLEVVVVGAGIAGFAVAYELSERGAAVSLVDAGRPGGGATGASAGLLAAQYESSSDSPLLQLYIESRTLYPKYAAALQELSGHDLRLRWDGMLVANTSAAEHESALATARWQQEAGLRAEVLETSEAARLLPGLSHEVVSYTWLPDEGQIDTQVMALALSDAISRTGIRLITGNGVASIESREQRAVGVALQDGRKLEGERVVLAAGAWSGQIGGLPRALPVRPVRGQILRLPAKELGLKRVVATHAGRYLVPRWDGSALAGSTMDDVGFDQSLDERGLRDIQTSLARIVPALAGLKPRERWAGLRPISADSRPVIGPDPELEGLLYATGYGRDGILIAPVAGRVVADLTLTGESTFDWLPYRPDRFAPRGDERGRT